MAENLKPHHVPEATGRGIDRYLAVWSLEHPEMLRVSADDLLQLSGVGPKRRSQLVEMVVDLAVDGVPEGPAQQTGAAKAAAAETQPVLGQRQASTASLPEVEPPAPAPSDPTPEELLAAANAPRYTPASTPSSLSAPALTDPAPAPVKRLKATKVFKWSAVLGMLCFPVRPVHRNLRPGR